MTLEELANGPPLDAAIIGGGINGCAIAAEAAARGAKVALFEADDFGFGTTWRTTKLIHGGLRYLEHGDLRLVFESLRERTWLLKTRPYLVRPQRFILPMLPWTRRPAWQLRAGLAMYDTLSLYRGLPAHRGLSEEAMRDLAPYLPEVASGGFSFFDARVLAPERLALELALLAREAGAAIHNHTPVTRIGVQAGRVTSVEVKLGSGSTYEIPSRMVINAAGPWVDPVNERTELPMPELLGVTRGSHIALELDGDMGHDAVFSTARSDGRVLFAVPQGKLLLVGTTDDRYDGDPSDVRATPADIEYLLAEAQALLPGRGISRGQVRYAYSGLRPLQRVAGGPEAAITRRHAVIEHREQGGPQGLVSVVGGKLSTFRPLAREAAGLLPTADRQPAALAPRSKGWRERLLGSGLPKPMLSHLRVYGGGIESVLELGKDPLCEHASAIAGEVVHAARHEQGVTLSDILMRRTGIAWASCRGTCCYEAAVELAGRELGWGNGERKRQVKAFERDIEKHLPTVELVDRGKKARGNHNP